MVDDRPYHNSNSLLSLKWVGIESIVFESKVGEILMNCEQGDQGRSLCSKDFLAHPWFTLSFALKIFHKVLNWLVSVRAPPQIEFE